MSDFTLRAVEVADRDKLGELVGSNTIVTPGGVYDIRQLAGLAAVQDDTIIGLLTYHIEGAAFEIVTLHSCQQSIGVGTALIQAAREIAIQAECKRLWLVTTNDNLYAMRFYQKRGFVIASIHRNSMQLVRAIKPEVPPLGMDGIPLRDMIEFEMLL